MVNLWCTLRCVIISDGSLYCGPWFVCNRADLFYFLETIFEFSIEYRVYESGSKLFLGAWSPIKVFHSEGCQWYVPNLAIKFPTLHSHLKFPPPLVAYFTPSSYHGFVSNCNNRKMGFYCILWYQLLGIKLVWKIHQNTHFLVPVLKLSL